MWIFVLVLCVLCASPALGSVQEAAPATTQQSPQIPQDHQSHAGRSEHTGHAMHKHHNMYMDASGMVMNENTDELPRGCPRIGGEQHITVRAGKEFARDFKGTMFGYDQHEWSVEPCTKLTVTLINSDDVRHQWMLHGLPRYIYDQGMFTLEIAGKGEKSATFIVPPGQKTYLVHCDVPHHMEKGMKAQLKVGGGDGDLPSIPGITGPRQADPYIVRWGAGGIGLALFAGLAGIALAGRGLGLL